jgi:glycosyltransferase involved in cell wall biosynthesis
MNAGVPKLLRADSVYTVGPSVATQDFGWDHAGLSKDKFTVISAGRFIPLKGFDLTIEAFANFYHTLHPTEQQKCQLLLIGSGPEEPLLKKLIQKLNVQDAIHCISWIERDQLMAKFKSASVFLFPSHEGAGMVVAEALSFGLPIVCLDNEGPGGFIDSQCGIAVPDQDYENTVKGLSMALAELFHKPQKRIEMGKAARQKFEASFHWDRRGEHLREIYKTL